MQNLLDMNDCNLHKYSKKSLSNIIKKIHKQDRLTYETDITKGKGKTFGNICKLQQQNERNTKYNRDPFDMSIYSDAVCVQTENNTFEMFPSSNGPHIFVTRPTEDNKVEIIDINVINKLENLNKIMNNNI